MRRTNDDLTPLSKQANMFERKTSDLHLHLNGSFSLAFLKETAKKNNIEIHFQQLQELRAKYNQLITEEKLKGNHLKSIQLIWQQFSLIHKMIQTVDDIRMGTIDVIKSSKAKYLEIRTTPKSMHESSQQQYIDSFVAGIRDGIQQVGGKKAARGILSIDRTIHTQEEAYAIIDQTVSAKIRHGFIIGIDLSGNPAGERIVTGESLRTILRYALSKDIGIALHIGEINNAIEKDDVNVILNELELWHLSNPLNNRFSGKIRLGHGIYLTSEQQNKIRELQIPIEVCPTCHERLDWWNTTLAHPVTSIYQSWKDPVVTGTDDELIFGGNAKSENKRAISLFGFQDSNQLEEVLIHQSKFRFGLK